MHSTLIQTAVVGLISTLVAPVDAYWRMGCGGTLIEGRVDPVVTPGKTSGHVHTVLGGNGFAPEMDYASTQRSTCTSCSIQGDFSNYWIPKLYYMGKDGSFTDVPTSGGTVYYQQRAKYPGKKLTAFPAGFRMVAGNPERRAYDGSESANATKYVCLNYGGGGPPEAPGFPTVNCPDGLRAQVYFPSCWDGVHLDSADHQSHVAYPIDGFDHGTCPDSHPVPLISIFYEFIFGTGQFANQWYGGKQPFVWSMGDKSGYGMHGDFVNGWDVNLLQYAIDHYTTDNAGEAGNVYFNNIFSKPAISGDQCKLPSLVDEQIYGTLPALPGCNPVTDTPQPIKDCAATKAVGPVLSSIYTDMTAKGWAYLGCGVDEYGNKALGTGSVEDSPSMTVERCIDVCGDKGFSIAGLEYASQCFCGNSLPARASPVPGAVGNCNMACKGNSAEKCGAGNHLSLYQKCSGTCNNADFSLVGSGGTMPTTPNTVGTAAAVVPSSSAAPVAASSVAPAAASPSSSRLAVAAYVVPSSAVAASASSAPPPAASSSAASSDNLPTNVKLPSGWKPKGCYSDNLNPRSMTGIQMAWFGKRMTSSGCADYCHAQGFSMAGTENGGQCFCANALSQSQPKPGTDCNFPCEGDPSEICGGPARLSVFGVATDKRRRHVNRHVHAAAHAAVE